MNRAQRRAMCGTVDDDPEPVQILTLTQEQLNEHLPHLKNGDVVKIKGRRRNADGTGVEPCEEGLETLLRIRVVAATAKPH